MTKKYKSSMVLAVLMVAQSVPLNVMAFNLTPNSSKKASLSAPTYAKLESSNSSSSSTDNNSQPDPDLSTIKLDEAPSMAATTPAADATEKTAAASTSVIPAAEPIADQSMAPVTNTTTAATTEDGGTLNATVEKEGYVPKPPVERTDTVVGEESVVSGKGKSKKDAKAEAQEKAIHEMAGKLGPLELQQNEAEVQDKVVTIVDAERAELAEIWDAALCRSQDIQFVVQKLMPTKDPKHSTAVMMKMLSTAMYGAVAAGGMMGGSAMGTGGYMAQSAGASLVMSVLNGVQSRSARKAAVTETEAIMLYNMIRNVSDKVGDNFHSYKRGISQVGRACTDFEDLQKMVSDARAGQNATDQINSEYMLRKAKREIDALNEDTRHAREQLVNLAGNEAVDILDKQIAIESQKIGQPIVAQDDIPSEESIPKGKLANKSTPADAAGDGQDDAAPKKKIAEAPKKKTAAKAKPADEASADEENASKDDADMSSEKSDKPL